MKQAKKDKKRQMRRESNYGRRSAGLEDFHEEKKKEREKNSEMGHSFFSKNRGGVNATLGIGRQKGSGGGKEVSEAEREKRNRLKKKKHCGANEPTNFRKISGSTATTTTAIVFRRKIQSGRSLASKGGQWCVSRRSPLFV